MHLSRLKSWLEQQTHISAIDMSAILEKVGPHVLTASQAFLPKRLGEFAYVLTTIPETPTFSVCKLLEVASSPFLTRPILAIAAFFLRYGLILPQAQEALMEHLPGALPLERLLQSVPQTVLTLTGEIESFIVARISDSLNGLQKATSELLDLRRLLDAQRQFGPVLLEQRVELAKQDLAISYNFLTNSVKSLCSGKDAVGKFLCDPDIRSYLTGDPAKLQELAAKYNLTPEDSGFLTLLENMIKTGKPISITDVLLEKAQDTETAEKAGQIVNNVLEIRANTHTLIESLWQTAVGRAATEVGKAVSESSLGTYTASFASAVSAPVTKALDATNTLFRQLRGVEQAIPEELKQDLTLIQIYQENLSQAKADEELYTTAIARLYAIQQSSWQKYLLLPIAEQKVYSDAMKASLSVLQKAVDMLKPCLHVAKANTLLASAQLAPEPVAEHYLSAPATTSLQSTMALGALKSVVSLASDPGKIKQVQAVTGLIMNGTVNAAQLSALCGGTLSILPNFIRHFIPPLLDTYGPALAENTHSFFHNLATGSLTLFDAPGRWAQASAEAAGTWALHYAMHTLGFVSQARIDNFMKLTDQEKLHLIDLAKAATQDPKALKKLQGTAQEQAECALSILDSLSTEDQLRISPTSFLSLSPEKQEKIMQIVHRYGGLKKSEQNNPVVIVKKFNELDPWIRQQVDMMSIQDFVRMSSDRQEDFRFYLVQSGSYEGATIEEKRKFFLKIKNMTNRELEALIPDMAALTAKDKAHLTPASLRKMHPAEIHQVLEIVQRYHPELLHKRLDVKRLEKYLQKPPIDYVEDKIRDDLPFITTQPLSEDTFDQLLPAQKNQIVTFLHTFSKFADLEFESGDEFDVDLITGAFNSLLEPELPIQQKERETLLETLAFVFHELPISEKKELLSLTQPVWNSYKKSEQIRLIQFLCSQPGFETRFSRLNQQILNLESGNAVDIDFVLTCFNSLQPFAQSNFKKTHQDSLEIPETLKANVQREVLHIRAKLKVIEEKLIKLRKYEYPTYQQRLHQALTNNDQDKTVQAKKGLENTIKKAQALEHERDKLSKELKTLQKLCDTGFRFNEEIERAFFEDESITALEAEQARLAKALKKFAAHVFEAKAAILLQKTDLGEFKTTLRSYQQECTEIENSLYRTCREYEDLALSLSQTIAERTAQGRHLTELLQAIDQHIQASRSLTHTALIWKDTRAEEAAKRALIHRAKTACQESITGLDQEHMRLQRLQSDKSAEQQKEDALAKTETNPTIKTAHEERSKALKTEIAYIDQQRSEIKARYEKLKAVYENASISLKQLHQVLEEEMLLIEQEKIDKQMQRTVLQIVHIPANAEMQTAFDEARKKFNKQVEEIRARLADQ